MSPVKAQSGAEGLCCVPDQYVQSFRKRLAASVEAQDRYFEHSSNYVITRSKYLRTRIAATFVSETLEH